MDGVGRLDNGAGVYFVTARPPYRDMSLGNEPASQAVLFGPVVRQNGVVASTSPDPLGTGNRKRTAGQCAFMANRGDWLSVNVTL